MRESNSRKSQLPTCHVCYFPGNSSTLHCRSIKASTIGNYLHDVASFLGRFRAIDPRFVSATDTKLAPVIAKVLDEQRRWESVPKRREPFTLELHNQIATLPTVAENFFCLDHAMSNWTLIYLYIGCRGIEWAQQTNCNHRALTSYHSNRFGNAYAFTRNDVQCFTENSLPLFLGFAIENPEMVGKIKLRFEEQQNGENGEWKLFTKNVANPKLCFATHFMAILKRHAILTNSSPHIPLSVYKGTDGQPYNIKTVEVEHVIRTAAATLFQLDPIKNKAQLALWSSHSLRVGACTTLYSQGFTEMEIKHLLR